MTRSDALLLWPLLVPLLFAGCVSAPPEQIADVCGIFTEKPRWYWGAKRAERRWDVPVAVLMATAYQESSYKAKVRPPRTKLLWVIPWVRPSSAYGYAQATDEAWRDYVRSTGRGLGVSRDDFGNAIDFVGWYHRRSVDQLALRRDDTQNLYLAYHEGVGGFRRGTWRKKGWLREVAQRVAQRAETYQAQLERCEDKFSKKPWWQLF